jgi:hypothetical protein
MSLWQLASWSFLMASVHGAGLMLLPVLAGDLAGPVGAAGAHHHGAAAPQAPPPPTAAGGSADPAGAAAEAGLVGLAAAGVHSLALLASAGVVALLAYEFAGVHALRLRGVTMDRVWPFALITGGVFAVWTAM